MKPAILKDEDFLLAEPEISENKAEERIKQDLIKENVKMRNVFSAEDDINKKFKKERQMNFDNRIINRKRKLKEELTLIFKIKQNKNNQMMKLNLPKLHSHIHTID